MECGITQYLTEYGPECRRRLTHHYNDELAEFSLLVRKMKDPLLLFAKETPDLNLSSARTSAYTLLHKAANALVAGFELAISGYAIEPPILYRTALETCTVAWDIVSNESSYADWNGNNFRSTHSISRLARIDKFFSKLWGVLSERNVHISRQSALPPLHDTKFGSVMRQFGFLPTGEEEDQRIHVELGLMVAHNCLQLTEITFYPFVTDAEATAESVKGKFVVMHVSDRHQKFVDSFNRTRAFLKSKNLDHPS